MKATISLDGVLSFIRSLSLTASNKRWLAERLLEEARKEEETKVVSSAAELYGIWTDDDFPGMTADELAEEIKSSRKFRDSQIELL